MKELLMFQCFDVQAMEIDLLWIEWQTKYELSKTLRVHTLDRQLEEVFLIKRCKDWPDRNETQDRTSTRESDHHRSTSSFTFFNANWSSDPYIDNVVEQKGDTAFDKYFGQFMSKQYGHVVQNRPDCCSYMVILTTGMVEWVRFTWYGSDTRKTQCINIEDLDEPASESEVQMESQFLKHLLSVWTSTYRDTCSMFACRSC